MNATLKLRDRRQVSEGMFTGFVIWQVPMPLRGSVHNFEYRLAFVVKGICVMRYDNEAGKGDHKHIGEIEYPYTFESIRKLMVDFDSDMRGWINDNL